MNILLIEDHPIIIESITNAINDLTFSCFSCDNIKTGEEILESRDIDLIISDIRLKNSTTAFDLLEKLSGDDSIPVMIYTSYVNQWLFVKFRQYGILPRAVIEKTEIPDWKWLISQILNGKSYYSPSAMDAMHHADSDPAILCLLELSHRKMEILSLLLNGMSDKDMAHQLELSKHTINSYRKELYKSLNVNDATGLIIKLRNYGYYDIEG